MRVITGIAKGRPLFAPRGRKTRPTADRVKEALFSILGGVAGERCLDLFAGSGALGIEALSRGAESCLFVEREGEALRALKTNLERTGLGAGATVWRGEALRALQRLVGSGITFTLVFLDPPYGQALVPKCLTALTEGGLVAPGGRVVAETAWGEQLPAEVGGLVRYREARYGQTVLNFYHLLMPFADKGDR